MGAAGAFAARQPLAASWRLCAVEPGSTQPPPQADPCWIDSAGPMTAAAALRANGSWSLDGSARDFDAQDWWYLARFDAPDAHEVVLGFDGLATLAEATLNGEPLLSSDNMFLAHRCDVGRRLRGQDNELLIRFGSLQAALGRRRARPRWRTPMVAHQQLRWWRTTLMGRTPGWSPPAAPVGPWRGVWWSAGDWQVEVQCELRDGEGWVTLDLRLPSHWSAGVERAELVLTRGDHRIVQALPSADAGGVRHVRVHVPRPTLWWPHTHGEPALYELSLQWQSRHGGRPSMPLGRLGFRTIELDTAGGGFAVRVNGQRVFCRGAGWTPLDPVSLHSDRESLRSALVQARDGGVNMLRLAGTMVYEEDAFYELCDELGLLAWQDLMFASMDYPLDDAAFARAAQVEVRQQLQRLRPHPCVAVLCGNSEVEQQAAMWGAPRELWQPRFFHDTVPALCRELAPALAYWPSSAHGGAFPHAADAGTTSYYGVGAYERPLEDARRSGLRFATECLAFANIPAPSALERVPGGLATRVHHAQWKARSPRDLGAGWDFDDVRDHYVRELFAVDPARLRHQDHDRYLALGRLATAEVMRAAFSEWRRPASGCGGALLLFLRDLWAGAGWGALDDQGVPKACWHALRETWQPLAVLLTDEGMNGLAAHVVNDGATERRVTLQVTAWKDGQVQVVQGRRELVLAPRSGTSLGVPELLDTFLDLTHAWRFGPPACEAIAAKLLDEQGCVLSRAFHFPLGLSEVLRTTRASGLAAEPRLVSAAQAQVTLRARELAVGVHFDVPGWQAAEEHFHLAPGEERTVVLHRSRAAAPFAGDVHALNRAAALSIEIPE